jgi:hypothetical protein
VAPAAAMRNALRLDKAAELWVDPSSSSIIRCELLVSPEFYTRWTRAAPEVANLQRDGLRNSIRAILVIDKTPQMPQISASIVSQDHSPVTGTATWRIIVSFAQKMRPDGHEESQTTAFPFGPLQQVAANQPWSAPFGSFAGGEAQLLWTYNGVDQTPFDFCIRGTNPDVTAATSMLSGVPYWFAKNIAIHETNMSQFCEAGRAQVAFCADTTKFTLPIWGTPGGYGMMQVDPPPSQDAIWNWTSAINAGQNQLQDLAGPAIDTSATIPLDKRAYPFWLRQVKQWETFNSALPAQSQVPAPVDPGPLFSPNCNFISSKTSSTGANTYWFGDPTLIKQYGGTIAPDGRNANYVSWIQGLTPHWEFDKANKISKDVAYEVCTCVSSSSCQHLGP